MTDLEAAMHNLGSANAERMLKLLKNSQATPPASGAEVGRGDGRPPAEESATFERRRAGGACADGLCGGCRRCWARQGYADGEDE